MIFSLVKALFHTRLPVLDNLRENSTIDWKGLSGKGQKYH